MPVDLIEVVVQKLEVLVAFVVETDCVLVPTDFDFKCLKHFHFPFEDHVEPVTHFSFFNDEFVLLHLLHFYDL